MLNFIQNLIGWSSIVSTGLDATVYFWIAMIATLLFIIRLVMMLIGVEHGGDIDISGGDAFDGIEVGHVDTDVSFNIFSLFAILSFFMGLGWMGMACRLTWGFGPSLSVVISLAAGVGMMMLASIMMMYVKQLERVVTYDVKTCIGHTGRVYLTIPGEGRTGGQVEVSISGRRKIMNARTRGDEIAAFTPVKVVEVGDDETLIVEPV